jgi:uncharacterized protein YndB with AHSA1/START domain
VTELRIQRVLPAPIERVWAALTRPEALAAWFWPPRLDPAVTADPRPGGEYRIAGTGMAVSGRYVEVDEPRRLVFTWRWDGDTTESLVCIDLVAVADKTELTLVHDRLDGDEDRANHLTGWDDCLDRLAASLRIAA